MKLSSPTVLDTMSWPQNLLHLGWTLECDQVIQSTPVRVGHLAVITQLPHVDIVNEGDVVGRVPVQAVAVHGEGHGVQQGVDGRHHLFTILTSWTVLNCQAARDKVILNINNNQCRFWFYNLI